MAIRRYLAQTSEEFTRPIPEPWKAAWMACHFSPYDSGLTGLPNFLPMESLLILNDRIPPMNCDTAKVFSTLQQIIHTRKCHGVLLDFQRPGCHQLQEISSRLIKLPCPVAVSPHYATELSCPVFLPPVPLLTTLGDYLSPWTGREFWIEAVLTSVKTTVDKQGSRQETVPYTERPLPFRDENLLCHYRLQIENEHCSFHLQRTRQDLEDLLEQAAQLGVTTAVGLWQELN